MKASINTNYGSPDVLQLKEVEQPIPADDEVLIKIHATTVNRTDNATLKAIPFIARIAIGLFKPKQPIVGSEFAGEIEAVGKNVSSFKVGDKVFGFNESCFGAHAEYMTIAEDAAFTTIPEGISFEQAAASSEGAYYAYNFINKVNITPGTKVLVNGATGAIGSALVQLLKHFKADVTATCGTKNLDLVKGMGANKVIDYKTEDFTKTNEKFSFVFDAVGKSAFGKCKPIMEPDGIFMASDLGPWWQNLFLPFFTKYFGKRKVLFPMPTDCRDIILFVKGLMEKGEFKALIDRTYTLENIVDAYRYVEKGQKIGNVVITVKHNI